MRVTSFRAFMRALTVLAGLAFSTSNRAPVVAAQQGSLPPAPNFSVASAEGARVYLGFLPGALEPRPTHFVIEAGSAPGASDLAVFNSAGYVSGVSVEGVPAGTYYLRVRTANSFGISPPSNERVLTVTGCTAPPSAPVGFLALYSGQSVEFQWALDDSGCAATSYLIEAGSAPTLTDVAVVPVTGTRVAFAGVPIGVYYVRLRARNAQGVSAPSIEQTVYITGCLPPPTPIDFQTSTLGNFVHFQWNLPILYSPPTTSPPTGYVLEAGSQPGAGDLAVLPFSNQAGFFRDVWGPPGTYWTRLRATNACGSSAPTPDVAVTLTSECVVPGRLPAFDAVGGLDFVSVSMNGTLGGAVTTGYAVDIGTAPGQTALSRQFTLTGGLIQGLAPGTYFARARATNVCGSGPPSREATFVVGEGCVRPSAPMPSISVTGQTVRILWYGSLSGPLEFQAEIGSADGASDIAVGPGNSIGFLGEREFVRTLPPGHYFARVRAANTCGPSNPSGEMEFTIQP